jgi:hypothetical protein
MTSATYSFPAAISSDGDAISDWISNNQRQPPASNAIRKTLALLPNLLQCSEHGEIGVYVIALNDHSVITQTAAIAKKANFIVNDRQDGWTAIEPMCFLWDDEPGAHVRWSAEISEFETANGKIPALWISYSSAETVDDVEHYQGDKGWNVNVVHTSDAIKISFQHCDATTAA